jgi:sugar lactone lactonase YvrE
MLLLLSAICKGQMITTIAGGGVAVNTGDGGSAIIANISYPVGGFFDKNGVYYFSTNSTGNSIRKITPDKNIYLVAGTGASFYSGDNGPATAATLNRPQAVAIDKMGNVYIADAGNNRIRKVNSSTGIISTIAGTGMGGFSGDGGHATSAKLLSPQDLCFDSKGNLYIAENANARVRKIDTSGIITTVVGTGTVFSSAGGGRADTTSIVGVSGLCVDQYDNLYIADWQSRVYKVTSSGIITTVVGNGISGYSGDGGSAISASTIPLKVTADKLGNIYIAEYDQNRIRKVNAAGIIYTIAGNGSPSYSGNGELAVSSQVDHPAGIAADSCNNIYIADCRNHRIRKIAFNPDCIPMAVAEVTETTPTIYPTPATATVTINAGVAIAHISICNAVGQQVLELHPTGGKKSVEANVQHLPAGIYVVMVNGLYAGKMVKGE